MNEEEIERERGGWFDNWCGQMASIWNSNGRKKRFATRQVMKFGMHLGLWDILVINLSVAEFNTIRRDERTLKKRQKTFCILCRVTTSDDNNERGKIFPFLFLSVSSFLFYFSFSILCELPIQLSKTFPFRLVHFMHTMRSQMSYIYIISFRFLRGNKKRTVEIQSKQNQKRDKASIGTRKCLSIQQRMRKQTTCVPTVRPIYTKLIDTNDFTISYWHSHTLPNLFELKKAKAKESKLKIRHRKTLLYWNISELSALWVCVCASCCCSEIYMYLFREQREYFSLFFLRRRHRRYRGLFWLPDVQITCHHIRNESLLISFS